MERMSKEKESGTLLGVGTAYLPVKEIKGEFYVKESDFTRCMDDMRKELEEENKKLKEENEYRKSIADVLPEGKGHIAEETIQDLQCRIRDLTREKGNLSELNRKQSKAFGETMKDYRELLRDYMKIGEENKNLKEKVETLELWLDNKEKLNEEYRKQIDKYKRQYEHSMGEDDELIYEEGLYD